MLSKTSATQISSFRSTETCGSQTRPSTSRDTLLVTTVVRGSAPLWRPVAQDLGGDDWCGWFFHLSWFTETYAYSSAVGFGLWKIIHTGKRALERYRSCIWFVPRRDWWFSRYLGRGPAFLNEGSRTRSTEIWCLKVFRPPQTWFLGKWILPFLP